MTNNTDQSNVDSNQPYERAVTDDWVTAVNADMQEMTLDSMINMLDSLGVPKGIWTDDQLANFIMMYNVRGDMLQSLQEEVHAYRHGLGPDAVNVAQQMQIAAMENSLVEIANWPNPTKDRDIQALKVLAAAMVPPNKVRMFSSLTS